MGELDTPFEKLIGRQATDKERQRFYEIRDAYGLKGSDAMWSVVMLFENYLTLFEAIPARVADSAREGTKAARATAEALAKAAQEETKRQLMKTVHDATIGTAKQTADAHRAKWVSICVSLVAVLLVVVAWWQQTQGESKDVAAGQNAALKACGYLTLAASWANTPDGRRAYDLEKVGSLHDLVNCSGKELERKGDWCEVQSDRRKTIYRWRIAATDDRKTAENGRRGS